MYLATNYINLDTVFICHILSLYHIYIYNCITIVFYGVIIVPTYIAAT